MTPSPLPTLHRHLCCTYKHPPSAPTHTPHMSQLSMCMHTHPQACHIHTTPHQPLIIAPAVTASHPHSLLSEEHLRLAQGIIEGAESK